jgi:beta-lactamase superfamily II metal-dependent hydrolase
MNGWSYEEAYSMAHRVTFYPEGNADTCLVEPDGGEMLLFDYADKHGEDEEGDLRVDLSAALREKLEAAGRDGFDVVAFTHLDDDHIHGATEFFHLRHALRYQIGDRAEIDELWVPSAAITEENLKGEAAVIRAEARYRLRKGEGIRVFSRPGALADWLASQGIALEDRRDLITDAGQVVPERRKEVDGIEFFAHSPFAHRQNENELVDRNRSSLVLQVAFRYGTQDVRLFLSADSSYEALADIVRISLYHGNDNRLRWDIMKIAHHCSYTSLGPEKGAETTKPVDGVAQLLEDFGQTRGILVSSSKPIPTVDTDQPPHRQAANYYRRVARGLDGEFEVTMQHPKSSRPEPLVITIDGTGASVEKIIPTGSLGITTSRAPRAGRGPSRAG